MKAHRRAQAAGARSLQLDDVYQELMIAWCAARDNWDEAHGVPFLPYLMNGMKKAINRFLRLNIEFGQMTSLDDGLEDDATFHEVVPDDMAMVGFEVFERDNARDAVMDALTPVTRQFVAMLREPPEFMLDAVRARRARQEFAKTFGLPVAPESDRVTASMVFDFLELSKPERDRTYAELRRVRHE